MYVVPNRLFTRLQWMRLIFGIMLPTARRHGAYGMQTSLSLVTHAAQLEVAHTLSSLEWIVSVVHCT
jgi:hypothetical protein